MEINSEVILFPKFLLSPRIGRKGARGIEGCVRHCGFGFEKRVSRNIIRGHRQVIHVPIRPICLIGPIPLGEKNGSPIF